MIVVPFLSRRVERVKLIQKAQHAVPSFFLIADGLERLGAGAGWSRVLGAAEVVFAGAVIGTFIRAIRALRRPVAAPGDEAAAHAHGGIDWVDLSIGAMLLVEALVHRQESGHLPRPTILLASAVIVLGLAHGRITALAARRRVLTVSDEGLSLPGRFFRTVRFSWEDLAAIDVGDRSAQLLLRNGRTRLIDLDDVTEPTKVKAALLDARSKVAPPPPAPGLAG